MMVIIIVGIVCFGLGFFAGVVAAVNDYEENGPLPRKEDES